MAAVPNLIVPLFSDSGPIMKPGSSTKLIIGIWKLLQKSENLSNFFEALVVIAPA